MLLQRLKIPEIIWPIPSITVFSDHLGMQVIGLARNKYFDPEVPSAIASKEKTSAVNVLS